MFSTIVSGIILLIFICAIIGMNINKLVKSGLALLFFTIGYAIEPTVYADENQLQEQHIHAYIHEDGSATITEERKVHVTEGTEMFIVIGNLGKSLITNFTVEEDGETYEYLDEWDVDASLEEKAKKNGKVIKDKTYELSWGVGDYGDHTYIVQYKVINFIKQLEDSQMLFWRFVNDKTNAPPEKVTLEIEADKDFEKSSEKIWAFGYEGDINFSDGKVYASSDEALTDKNYVTVLMRLPDETYGTFDQIDKTFDEIKEEAFDGSDYGKSDERQSTLFSIFEDYIILALLLCAAVFVVYFIIIKIVKMIRRKTLKYSLKGQYFRDIPYDGEIADMYYLLLEIRETNFEKMFAAYMLKWIKEEKIDITSEQKTVFYLFRRKTVTIHLLDRYKRIGTQIEGALFGLIEYAVDSENKLTNKEFKKWLKKHRSKITSLESDMKEYSEDILLKKGYIKRQGKPGFLKHKKLNTDTEQAKEFEKNVYKFYHYLNDFSLLEDQESMNVNVWDTYMIWAAMLGITEEVYEQLVKINPKYYEFSVYHLNHITLTNSFVSSISTATPSAGGGGAASIGGGGGSFGGGSGGGFR